jgi:Leucine-rich repeat (LRR) protein
MQSLEKAHLNVNIIENIEEFSNGEHPKLHMLSLESNNISKISKLPFPMLNQLFVSKNPL